MPFDSNGNYNLPGGYLAVTGQTIQASQHNPPLEDISSALSQVLLRSGAAPMTGNLPMGGFRITNMANGIADSDAATMAQASVPIGSVIDFAGPAAPPSFLLCYGQAVSRSTYAELYSFIGTSYGPGDGSTTFNVPDLRGRVVAGKDDMGGTDSNRLAAFFGIAARVLGGAFGTASHILNISEMPRHRHGGATQAAGGHSHTVSGLTTQSSPSFTGNPSVGSAASTVSTSEAPNHTHGILFEGLDQAHTNTQPTMIMNKIIKATRA